MANRVGPRWQTWKNDNRAALDAGARPFCFIQGCEQSVSPKFPDNISRHFADSTDQGHIHFAAASKARLEWFPAHLVIAAVDVAQARAIKAATSANQHHTVGALTSSSTGAPAIVPNLHTSRIPGFPGPYAFRRGGSTAVPSSSTGSVVPHLVPAPTVSSLAEPSRQRVEPQRIQGPSRARPAYDMIGRAEQNRISEEESEEETLDARGRVPADIAEAIADLNATTLSRLAYGKTNLTRVMQLDVIETAKAHIEDLDRKNDDLKIEVGGIAVTLDATQQALAEEKKGRRREQAESGAELEELRLVREVFRATGITQASLGYAVAQRRAGTPAEVAVNSLQRTELEDVYGMDWEGQHR